MARAIWTCVITSGLVTFPVGLCTATADHTVHFRQLQRGASDRVRNKRVNERTGDEVGTSDFVTGYELDEGQYVVVEPDELDETAPGRSQTIDIADFADLDRIEPVHFDRTYYIAPRGKEYTKVYELLRAGLAEADKAGIATFVMRNKRCLTALRAEDKVYVLQTPHWADEVRDPVKELPELPSDRAGRGKQLEMARQPVDALSSDWEPSRCHDTYQEKVREPVRAKAEGQEIAAAEEPPAATNVINLMKVLEGSLEAARSGRVGKEPATEPKGNAAPRKVAARSSGAGASGKTPARKVPPRNAGAARSRVRGTGGKRELEKLGRAEPYQRASEQDLPGRSEQNLPGRSKMSREELIGALARSGRHREKTVA
ncbi:non-homologous end joining protein Ku [Streptomyces eurythermus]|uniref:non-homologous end joining protein Ku n=1 Tax=Streptomyces eurythermus TaxID=42237 RepID=UPI0036F8C921